MTIKSTAHKLIQNWLISSTELTSPTIDINPTSLLPYYKIRKDNSNREKRKKK